MDLASFQAVYPFLIVCLERTTWEGNELEFYNFTTRSWNSMAAGAEPVLFSGITLDQLEGVIRSARIIEEKDVSMTHVIEDNKSMIGIIRGKNVCRTDEGNFGFGEFGEFSWAAEHKTSDNPEDFTAPDFFNPEDDLKDLGL